MVIKNVTFVSFALDYMYSLLKTIVFKLGHYVHQNSFFKYLIIILWTQLPLHSIE